jgi:spectinomycin phosphotransferase
VWTKPDISDDRIIACVRDRFGLRVSEATFLPVGADVNSAVYRVAGEDGALYLLKVRRGDFNEAAIAIPAYLHMRGILRVMAPIPTTTNELWVHEDGFDWMLYPFFAGKSGFEVALSPPHWIALGQTLRGVHTEPLPADLGRRVARESYSPQNRAIVKALDAQVERRSFDDPLAARFAAFWTSRRDEIQAVVERAEQLAQEVQQGHPAFFLCHSDLHAGNVLVGADDELAIVDWQDSILAPRERDLMFVGGGVGGVWNDPREARWFYTGYGPIEINPVAIAYYRYERIVADLAAYGERIFETQGSAEDREVSLQRVVDAFLPNDVIEIAHRSYSELT